MSVWEGSWWGGSGGWGGETEQTDWRVKLGSHALDSLVWTPAHVLRHQLGEDHEANWGGGPPEDACPQSVHWSTRAAIGSLSFRKGKGRRRVEVVQCRVPGMVWVLACCPFVPIPNPCFIPLLVGENSLLGFKGHFE